MEQQSYEKHAKFVVGYHRILAPLLLLTLIGSFVNVYQSVDDESRIYSATLISALTVAVFIAALYARVFALGVQDRVIRAEENMRHYLLTGKPLDPRLTVKQIVGLRFASDEEFPALAERAASENLALDDIKRAVKHWRADQHRI